MNDNNVTDDKCNKCESGRETTEHILSECRALAAKEYVNRHNNVAKILRHELAMKRGLRETSIHPTRFWKMRGTSYTGTELS
jgi:hypothetical protein